jgi:hypothetical protein
MPAPVLTVTEWRMPAPQAVTCDTAPALLRLLGRFVPARCASNPGFPGVCTTAALVVRAHFSRDREPRSRPGVVINYNQRPKDTPPSFPKVAAECACSDTRSPPLRVDRTTRVTSLRGPFRTGVGVFRSGDRYACGLDSWMVRRGLRSAAHRRLRVFSKKSRSITFFKKSVGLF